MEHRQATWAEAAAYTARMALLDEPAEAGTGGPLAIRGLAGSAAAFGDGREMPGAMSQAELAMTLGVMPGCAGSLVGRRKHPVAGHG